MLLATTTGDQAPLGSPSPPVGPSSRATIDLDRGRARCHGPRQSRCRRAILPDGWQPEGIAAGRGRLFVAGGPTGKAFIYDSRTGGDVAQLQLAAPGAETFVNDVALTRRTAYFTDSRRSAIYAVDTRAPGAPRTIALPAIPTEAGTNLNGIVATPGGRTLLAVQTNAGRLWRIDPAAGTAVQVDLGGAALTNGDGLLLVGRTLYVMRNQLNQIAVVRLNQDSTRGALVTTIMSTGFDVPSTIAMVRGELYAVNARFGTTNPQRADYWVTLVRR